MNADALHEAGFSNEEELYLYQDVCCTEIPLEDYQFEMMLDKFFENRKYGIKAPQVGIFNKKLYMEYIEDNNLGDLFDFLKSMTSVDRLIELYIYYFNKLSICLFARKRIELKMEEAIELFDGEKTEHFRNLLKKTYDDERKYYSIIVDYILLKRNERLKFPIETTKFDNAIMQRHESYLEFNSLLDNIGGKQF